MKPDILGSASVMDPDMQEQTTHQENNVAFDPGDSELSDENLETHGPDRQQDTLIYIYQGNIVSLVTK